MSFQVIWNGDKIPKEFNSLAEAQAFVYKATLQSVRNLKLNTPICWTKYGAWVMIKENN